MIDFQAFEELSKEELKIHLVRLAQRSKKNRQYLELLSSPEPEKLLLARIKAIKELDRYYRWNELFECSLHLRTLLEDIRNFSRSSSRAIHLILNFYETDRAVFEGSDDDGVLGEIYTRVAVDILQVFWQDCENKTMFRELLKKLVHKDCYGVRYVLEPFYNEVAKRPLPNGSKIPPRRCK